MTAAHCGQRNTVADGLGEVNICMWSSNRISLGLQVIKASWRNRVFWPGQQERKWNAPIENRNNAGLRAPGADLLISCWRTTD